MAEENAKRDSNNIPVLMGVTDDANAETRQLVVDPTTGRLKCTATLSDVDWPDNISNGTAGEVPTWDAAGSPTAVGPGTSGQVLTSNGAGAAPSFQNAGASGAPTDAKYVVAQANGSLSDEVDLGALTSGILKHTVAAGVSTPATATEGTDYYAPSGTDVAVADGGTGASDASTARTNLGLGTIATQAANNVAITGGSVTGVTDIAVADGGTGASDASTARTNLSAQEDVITTKGDLVIGDNSGDASRLAVGTNDQVLTADSSVAGGVKWADASSGGGGGSPTTIWWAGRNSGLGTPSASNALVWVDGAKRLLYGESTSWDLYEQIQPYLPVPRTETSTVSGLTISPAMGVAVLDSSTEYVVAAATGGTTIYRYDNDGTNETALTISGTGISDGARRIGYDPDSGRIYIQDGTDLSSTTVRRYTISGTTLTFVDTITLSVAPANAGFTGMHVGENYLSIDDSANNSTVTFHRYAKDTGTEQDNPTWGNFVTNDDRGNTCIMREGNELYIPLEAGADANDRFFFVKWTPDTP